MTANATPFALPVPAEIATVAHPQPRFLLDTFTLARLIKRDHRDLCRLVSRLTDTLPTLRPEFSRAWVNSRRDQLALHASVRAYGMTSKALVFILTGFIGPVALARLAAVIDNLELLKQSPDPAAFIESIFFQVDEMEKAGLLDDDA